jgi:tRNA/rRNA methyltransferase
MPSAPAIIMVRPQMGENIGAVARAMMNFGLSDLRIVAPRDGWPNAKAHEMAAHADYLIEQARVYNTLSEALADRQYVLASSAPRDRTLPLPLFLPEAGMQHLRAREGRGEATALLLGPESTGLTNEDMVHAHAIIAIPTDPANSSLNVAQALVLLAYAWFSAGEAPEMPAESASVRASCEDVEGLYGHLVNALDEKGYFHPSIKRDSLMRSLRILVGRAEWSRQEVQTLRGVIRCLSETPEKARN